MEYSPAEHLNDGNTYTLWQTKPGARQGEVLFLFDQEYTLETFKVFLPETARGTIRLEAINGEDSQVLTNFSVYGERGWRRIDLDAPVTTAQIRLVMLGEAVELAELNSGVWPEQWGSALSIATAYPQTINEKFNLELLSRKTTELYSRLHWKSLL